MINPKEVESSVVDIIIKSGDIVRKFLSEGFTSHSKGGVDFATEADDAVDEFLRTELKKLSPNSNFLTEETAPEDYQEFRHLDDLWIIDPIDGTTNFSRGHDYFCISVGLVSHAKTVLGIVYSPIQDRMFVGKDDGSLYLNKEKIKVSDVSTLDRALVSLEWSWDFDKRVRTINAFNKILLKTRAFESRGAAALDLASISCGKIDASIIYGVKPWDTAAASLFVKLAGGEITKPDGGEWDIFDPDFVASNKKIHQEIIELINN